MKLDIVTLEVIRNVLPAIANEMSWVLQRTSHNMMIYEVRDYCCALLDVKGRLLSQNTGGVSHFVANLGTVICDGVERYGEDSFHPGSTSTAPHSKIFISEELEVQKNPSVTSPPAPRRFLKGAAMLAAGPLRKPERPCSPIPGRGCERHALYRRW